MTLKIFIIAGEASGDRLGSKLMRSLKAHSKQNIEFCGVGGNLMEEEGLESLFPLEKISLMGFAEIIPHIFKIHQLILHTAKIANIFQPDIIVTIDSPGFCFRVIKKIIRTRNSKFIHYVSPSVWAYKEKRVHFIAQYYDVVLSLLPFEKKYYKHANILCEYVGHPISEDGWNKKTNKTEFKKLYNINQKSQILGVMAGSRESEVQTLLPIFIESINNFLKTHKDITVIFPTTSKYLTTLIEKQLHKIKCNTKIIPVFNLNEENRIKVLKSFDAAIVKSGTSSLELTFAKIPMIVAYKIHSISFFILKYYFKIFSRLKFASITNILLNKEVIPEYIQEHCTPDNITRGLHKLFEKKFIVKQQEGYEEAITALSNQDQLPPSDKAALLILKNKQY